MPADNTLSQAPSAHHGNAAEPYPCHAAPKPPGASWAISYGFCRTSMDVLHGSTDPRCPQGCKHKAPERVVVQFDELYKLRGNAAAAEYARGIACQQ